MALIVNSAYFLNGINKLIFIMVKSSVFFAVRTEFLNIILTSFGFKGVKRFNVLLQFHSTVQRTKQRVRCRVYVIVIIF
jgi:hypothetical protein